MADDKSKIDIHRPLKDAFGRFSTGIAIASCWNGEGDPVAITINSFASVSLAPPLLLWCLEKKASTFEKFMTAPRYGISILTAEQEDISNRFAGFEPTPLQAEEMLNTKDGPPLLKTCLAAFDCTIVDRHEAGDHFILIGKVNDFRSHGGAPLTYFASQYGVGNVVE